MTRGRHHSAATLAVLAALACALLGASAWLPAAASAAGSSDPTAAGPVKPAPPVLDDVMGRGDGAAAPELPIGLGALPGARETAAYAAGRVAVGVVFLESDGSLMPSSEGWNREDPDYPGQDRRQLVLAKVQSALDWWNARSPDGSLEVFLPAAGAYGAPQTVKTGYEPIRMDVKFGWKGRRVLSDAAWRWEAMGTLGFAHDAGDDTPYPETAFADRIRRQNGADWAFVLYVVDSLQDADGMFRNDVIAYTADLFGPYCMLTYDNDGYRFANFDAVLAHEMGHVFGALDEYEPPAPGYPSTGDLRSGYLGVRNGNAVSGGSTDLPCIMRGSNGTLSAFAAGDLCRWTVGQTGLRDSDADTRPDVVDTRPEFATRLESTDQTTGAVTLRGVGDGAAAQARQRHRRRVLPPRPQHPRAARRAVPRGRRRVAAAHGAGRRVRRGLRALDADHRAADPGPPRAGPGGDDRRDGRPEPETSGPAPRRSRSSSRPMRRSRRPGGGSPPALSCVCTRAPPVPTPAPGPRGRCRASRPSGSCASAAARPSPGSPTGENGVWTGTFTPARSGVYEMRFAGAGQFGAATSGRVTITVK